MHGARRVIVFCLLTAVLPTILLIIPLYLRHSVFSDVTFAVAESDVLEVTEGVSSIFCQEHSLRMNTSFNAYQVKGRPEMGNFRKHIRLKKSMNLVDDTLEYWGFYLLKGSTVNLSVCSRYEGARLLVVSGERNLRTCGLLQHSKREPVHPQIAKDQGEVKVMFKSYIQEDNKPVEYSTTQKAEEDENLIEQEQEEEEGDGLETFRKYAAIAKNYIESHKKSDSINNSDINTGSNFTLEEKLIGRKLRHARSRSRLTSTTEPSLRKRRDVTLREAHTLDANKVAHGNTGKNFTIDSAESSVSSFENNLLTCYDGDILLSQGFHPSHLCTNNSFVDTNVERMMTTHNVVSDGYYYYIFYSDNDFVTNDIHAIFDIHKPTYQFANNTNKCLNATSCNFSVSFGSDQRVIIEIPTWDGIERDDDMSLLTSTCHPRMAIYVIFPIMVLFLILGCAFL